MKKEVFFALILFSVFIVACSSSSSKNSDSSVVSEYNVKKMAVNSSLQEMNVPLERWNNFMKRIHEGGTIYAEDFHTTYGEFTQKSNITVQKIDEFEAFIDDNKEELDDNKIDTESEKEEAEIIKEIIANNTKNMKRDLSNIPQQ